MSARNLTRRQLLQAGAATALGTALAAPLIFTASKVRAARKEKIVYWHLPNFTPLADRLQKEQVYAFAKEAGLKDGEVQFTIVSNEEFIAKIAAALETGNPPDVARLYESFVQLYRSQGHMMQTDAIVKQMRAEPGGLFDSSLTAVGQGGHFWGVPLAVNAWPIPAPL